MVQSEYATKTNPHAGPPPEALQQAAAGQSGFEHPTTYQHVQGILFTVLFHEIAGASVSLANEPLHTIQLQTMKNLTFSLQRRQYSKSKTRGKPESSNVRLSLASCDLCTHFWFNSLQKKQNPLLFPNQSHSLTFRSTHRGASLIESRKSSTDVERVYFLL